MCSYLFLSFCLLVLCVLTQLFVDLQLFFAFQLRLLVQEEGKFEILRKVVLFSPGLP